MHGLQIANADTFAEGNDSNIDDDDVVRFVVFRQSEEQAFVA